MNPGDRINWSHVPRGGYGLAVPVAGVVVKVAAKRVLIEVRVRQGGAKEWTATQKWVDRESVTPRVCPKAVFDEPMRIEIDGFVIDYSTDGATVPGAFRSGTAWGRIDGQVVTGACLNAEQAVAEAHYQLTGGGYETSLRARLGDLQVWARQAPSEPQRREAQAGITQAAERLAKLLATGHQNKAAWTDEPLEALLDKAGAWAAVAA